jgi:hypothetical protein
MYRKIQHILMILALGSIVIACAPATIDDPMPGEAATPIPIETPQPVEPTPERDEAPAATPISLSDEARALADLAVADLAERLGISPTNIVVRSARAVEFPDTSLGVPEPGQMYAQVITPGYVLELEAEGETHVYHGAGSRVVYAGTENGARMPAPIRPLLINGGEGEALDADAAPYLAADAALLHQMTLDMVGDGRPEIVALAGYGGGPDRLAYDALELFVIMPHRRPGYEIVWNMRTEGDRGEALVEHDITGDGRPEILSFQAMGAGGQVLYVLAWRGETFDLLRPQGGHFGGGNHFGESGVWIDETEQGIEIHAAYGPAARSVDVYRWDGNHWVYGNTADGSTY